MMDYELLFLKSLALTVFIETLVMIVFFQYIFRQKEIGISKLLITGFLASFATLPYLWFVFPNYIDQKIWYIFIGESFAIIVESIIIAAIFKIKYTKSFLCSFICNMISFSTGLMINF